MQLKTNTQVMEELMMSTDLYRAAVRGDVSILPIEQGARVGGVATVSKYDEADKYFLSCTLDERNTILHLAARNDQNLDFIAKALERFPALIGQKNSKGDTALHVSARQGNKAIIKLLITCYSDIEAAASRKNDIEPLWRVKNLDGDTPLHTAMKRGKLQVAESLISLDSSLASSVNNFNETPLHLAAKVCSSVSVLDDGWIKHLSPDECILGEDMLRVLYLLLRKPSTAPFTRDKDGLTPLLKAACCRNCIPIVLFLIDQNPQVAEQRDLNGRTILHLIKIESYREGKRALEIPEINALKDEQDFDGNTPAHLAIKNSAFMKVRLLMEYSADFTINNNHDISPWELILSQEDFAIKMKEETDQAMNGLMEKQLYKAAVGGDLQFLSQHDDVYFLSRSTDGNNILHVALGLDSARSTDFVLNIVERFPLLLCQTNAEGDTPLHLAARDRSSAAQQLILFCKDIFQRTLEVVVGASFLYCAPWRVRNSEGNTPLHEALRAGNAICAQLLIVLDEEVTSFVNNHKETPLHVYARYEQVSGPLSVGRNWKLVEKELQDCSDKSGDELDLLLEANISAAFSRDADGFTPLLRAAQCNNVEKVNRMLGRSPPSAEISDINGRTLMHLMPLNDKTEVLMENPQFKDLIRTQDLEGNTPLHIAIKSRQYNKVRVLLKHGSKDLLDAVNNDGEASVDLIQSHTQVPLEYKHEAMMDSSFLACSYRYFLCFGKKIWLLEILDLVRNMYSMPQSVYGMSEATMKENVNILLVISVLLATITFAAGFTVPGGFNDKTGIPILISKGAFKVFLISDTYAMCCSMLALFSLIWFMTGKPSESQKLIDLSIFVIQQAFYGTTLAFMTGVYVAISPEASWTAILVCTFCSVLIACSLKPLNMLLSRIFFRVHGFLLLIATEYDWIPCLSCLCYALLSGSQMEW